MDPNAPSLQPHPSDEFFVRRAKASPLSLWVASSVVAPDLGRVCHHVSWLVIYGLVCNGGNQIWISSSFSLQLPNVGHRQKVLACSKYSETSNGQWGSVKKSYTSRVWVRAVPLKTSVSPKFEIQNSESSKLDNSWQFVNNFQSGLIPIRVWEWHSSLATNSTNFPSWAKSWKTWI